MSFENVEFAENRAYNLGRKDYQSADHIVRASMYMTATECPLRSNTPRCQTDEYWNGVADAGDAERNTL